MTQRDAILKVVAYGVALFAITVIKYYIIGPLPISLPLMLPVAAVAMGTLEGVKFGAGYGLAAGLVMSAAGHITPLCVPALAAVGWASGLMTQHVLRRDMVGHFLCTLLMLLVWELCQVGSRLVTGVAELIPLLKVAGPELLWSVVFSFPVYWIGRFCCKYYGRIYHE